MSTNHTLRATPKKPVLKMTDAELRENYNLFFPDGQIPDVPESDSPPGDFKKLSFLKDVPSHYSAHSLAGV